MLEALPNEVLPSQKGDWQYKRDYSESPGAIVVKETSKNAGYTYTDEYHSSGVKPSSVYVGLAILKQALSETRTPTEIPKGVLEYKE